MPTNLLHPLAQSALISPATVELIKQGGALGVITILCFVIVYFARKTDALHDRINASDAAHAAAILKLTNDHAAAILKLTNDHAAEVAKAAKDHAAAMGAEQDAHARELAAVNGDRLVELRTVTDALLVLDRAGRSVADSARRGKSKP